MGMTSHDRVLAAMNHEQADGRIPMDYSCVPEVTETLMAHFGVKTLDQLLEGFEIDMRTVEPRYVGTSERSYKADGTVIDMWGIAHDDLIRDGKIFKHYTGPFGMDTTVSDINSHHWPDPDRVDLSMTQGQCALYRDYGTFTGPWSPLFNNLFSFFGME